MKHFDYSSLHQFLLHLNCLIHLLLLLVHTPINVKSHRVLSSEEERSILLALGLSSPPSSAWKHKDGSHKSRINIPSFLQEQYIAQTGLEIDTSHFREPGLHVSVSNTVASISGKINETSSRFLIDFDFGEKKREGNILAAVLKVYWKPHSLAHRSHKTEELLQKVTPKFSFKVSDETGVLLDTKTVIHKDPEIDEGWISFDVVPALQNWLSQSSLRLHLTKDFLRLSKNIQLNVKAKGKLSEPYLIIYSEDEISSERRRAKRNVDKKNARIKIRKKKTRRNFCKRHELYVDFSIVGWNDWIVAPPGYHAYFCHGECPFPMSDHYNSTNHAIVQTLVNSVTPNAVPRACCIPTEMSPISMLYLDEYEKVVLKNYESMVVEGCGCR